MNFSIKYKNVELWIAKKRELINPRLDVIDDYIAVVYESKGTGFKSNYTYRKLIPLYTWLYTNNESFLSNKPNNFIKFGGVKRIFKINDNNTLTEDL